MPKPKRPFVVAIEAKMTIHSFDEDSAGKKVEKGLSSDRTLGVEVNAGAGVWTYVVVPQEAHRAPERRPERLFAPSRPSSKRLSTALRRTSDCLPGSRRSGAAIPATHVALLGRSGHPHLAPSGPPRETSATPRARARSPQTHARLGTRFLECEPGPPHPSCRRGDRRSGAQPVPGYGRLCEDGGFRLRGGAMAKRLR